MDGSWDMFHAGHISILKKAKERGDYLIAGVHSDTIVNQHQGSNLPIMNLHERVLSVLGCKVRCTISDEELSVEKKTGVKGPNKERLFKAVDLTRCFIVPCAFRSSSTTS